MGMFRVSGKKTGGKEMKGKVGMQAMSLVLFFALIGAIIAPGVAAQEQLDEGIDFN